MADQENEMELNQGDVVTSSMGEVQGETWQDEHPPEDDFHDQTISEGMTSEDEAEDVNPYDPAEQQEESTAKKKKTPLIVMGVLLLALVGIGSVIYNQLGNGADVAAFNEAPQVPPPPSAMTAPNEIPATPKTAESDLAALAEASRQAAADQGVAQPVPAQAASLAPTATPAEVVEPKVEATASVPQPALPPAELTAIENKPAEAPTAAPPMTPAAPQADAALEARLAALEGRMNDLQKSLENISVQSAELVARLEKGMSKMTEKKAAKAEPSSVLHLPENAGEEKPVMTQEEEVAPKPKAVAKKKAAPKPVAKASKSTPSTKWVLRAATPDGAWLSQGAEATELRKVEVGETVPGLGKIKSIREKNGAWEVVGTKGTAR